jgi:hypothetical protein
VDNSWSQTGPVIALAVFASLALSVALTYRLMARWNRRRKIQDATARIQLVAPPPIPADARHSARRAHVSTGVLAAVGAANEAPAGISPVLLAGAANAAREQQERAPSRSDHLDTTVSAMGCPECRRQYDVGGEHCPRDGAKLHLIETDAIAEDDHEMVCSICEASHPASAVFCADDGGRLAPRPGGTQSRTTFVPVAIPFCPTCHREHPPELRTCPDDGAILIQMLGRRSCGHPLLGVGPKRKICPECGLRYSAQMKFCTRERTRLVSLN